MVAAECLWHLGSQFYHDTQHSHRGRFTNLLWCDIPLNKATHTHTQATSHLARLSTGPFLWQRKEHRRLRKWVDEFDSRCWLWRISSRTKCVVAELGLPANLRLWLSWFFPASSIKFFRQKEPEISEGIFRPT